MADADPNPTELRPQQMLAAAYECFLRFGYSKTTMQDVANAAGVSRPLVYTRYRGKEELFLAMFENIFRDQQARVERLVADDTRSRSDRVMGALDIVYLEVWDRVIASAERADLLDASTRLFPRIAQAYTSSVATMIGGLLASPDQGELLLLSGKGLCYDRPSSDVLRNRLSRLVDTFMDTA